MALQEEHFSVVHVEPRTRQCGGRARRISPRRSCATPVGLRGENMETSKDLQNRMTSQRRRKQRMARLKRGRPRRCLLLRRSRSKRSVQEGGTSGFHMLLILSIFQPMPPPNKHGACACCRKVGLAGTVVKCSGCSLVVHACKRNLRLIDTRHSHVHSILSSGLWCQQSGCAR